MNIKVRLSIQFTLIVAGILLFFSILVYSFSYSSQLAKFRQNLLNSAENYATLLIDFAVVDSSLLNRIQQSTVTWEHEELAITDSAFNLIYGNNIEYLSTEIMAAESSNDDVNYFTAGGIDGLCYTHVFDGRKYYVYTLAMDMSRHESLKELRRILLWSILFSICLSVLLSYLFAKRAIRPISSIIKSVKELNSVRLSHRLDEGDKRDEIAQLAVTFNEMLNDLEIAFRNQEDFVSNASHELRTPLSVMISEGDYILSHERKKEDYLNHITAINNDLKKFNSLLTSLLELAQISKDKTVNFTRVRIDEIIFNSIYQTKIKFPDRKIIPKISYPENENDLVIDGNEGLLTIAFKNLLENACKFSDDDIIVDFFISGNLIKICIQDSGIGIPQNEMENIFRPFSRASNVKYIGGFGIGLSLVMKILELHVAEMVLHSRINEGTRCEIIFRKNPEKTSL
ncbi:MAG TPA: HAMP domain-containing sensor histidine kinase [Bacteroidales bacterium]|jgi:signal transduction histidine kinase|nr:HAMP domain-containing protein [Bacteroidales bacterium]HNR40774.1 HAMP domain-containing sensor histidine kinase [Bacteroidales bacterium]HQG76070.1 HAMP domain-containing sensor histidine kinase [Bacteroidales bacterium]